MGNSYLLTTIKGLFGQASHCAYPDCTTPLVFEDTARGVRSIAVDIAHIRSPRPSGPRHDPTYTAEKINSEENLLLLCTVHHRPVDRDDSVFSTRELLAWKEAQQAQGGGFKVEDAEVIDLVQRLEEIMVTLVGATQLSVEVSLLGGYGLGTSIAFVPLAAFPEISLPTMPTGLTRYRAVEASNTGMVGADVTKAGIELDVGHREFHPQWCFPDNSRFTFPYRLEGHSAAQWFVAAEQVRPLLIEACQSSVFAPSQDLGAALALGAIGRSQKHSASGSDDDSPHPWAMFGVARPGKLLDSTALGRRSLIRMKSEVQLLPGPRNGL